MSENELRLEIEQQAAYYFGEIRKFQPLDLDHLSLENWKDFMVWRGRVQPAAAPVSGEAEELAREIAGTCHYFDVDHDGSIPHAESPNCFDWKPLPTELSTKIAQVIEAHETSYAQKTSALWRWACTCGRIETVETREACVSATRLHWGHEIAALLRSRGLGERPALENLVRKLDEVHNHKAYRSVFQLSYLHGNPYHGPTYEAELNVAKKALGWLPTPPREGEGA